MLKSTFTPLFSTLPAKPKLPKPLASTILGVFKPQCSQPVRHNASLSSIPPASAYVHLPFCRKRCHYCDFTIIALGSSSSSNQPEEIADPWMVNYVNLLCREINATNAGYESHLPLETVFFGGGTPSLVPPMLVGSVLETMRSKFGVRLDAEISMEMDPGTFDGKKMKGMMEVGVNRVSLGVHAFQEELLKSCGRAHGVKEVYEAVEIVKSCGVANWNVDLISSLPHQTAAMWEESLRLTVEAGPLHVSVYDLQVKQGTKFGRLYTPGEFPLPYESSSAEFYRMASRTLIDAGYEHYEISSYGKSGYQCKHNLTYWKNKPFYGFGIDTASHIGGVRFSRPKLMKEYNGYVENLENGLLECGKSDGIDAKDVSMDVVMLSLRTSRGLDLKSFGEAYGGNLVGSLCKVYKPYVESGHAVFLDEQRRVIPVETLTVNEDEIERGVAYIRLSDPDGFLLSNELISLAFVVVSPVT